MPPAATIVTMWPVASFHYRLSFQSICTALPSFHLTHGVIYTFMTPRPVPVYRWRGVPAAISHSESQQIPHLNCHFGSSGSVDFFCRVCFFHGVDEANYERKTPPQLRRRWLLSGTERTQSLSCISPPASRRIIYGSAAGPAVLTEIDRDW